MTMRRTPEGGAAGRTGADAEAWNMSLTPPFAFDLVMFDLDGTLIETVADLSDALNDTLADLGHRPPAQALVAGWIGNGTRELLVRGLAEVTGQAPEDLRDSEPVRRAVAIFDPHYERRCGIRSRLAPHAADVLRRLRAHGVPGRRRKFSNTFEVFNTRRLALQLSGVFCVRQHHGGAAHESAFAHDPSATLVALAPANSSAAGAFLVVGDLAFVSAPSPGFARPPEGVQENLGAARRFLESHLAAGSVNRALVRRP